MKKIILLPMNLLAVLVVVIMSASCAGNGGKHVNAIPDNPVLLVKANLKNIIDDSDVLNNEMITSLVSVASYQLPNEYRDFVSELMKNPSSIGINIDEPVIYATLNEERGIFTAEVSDKSALTNNLNLITENSIRLVEEGGLTYLDVNEDEFCLAYNDDMIIALFDNNGISSKYEIEKYFNYDGRRAVDNADYKSFFKENDDFAYMMNGEKMLELFGEEDYYDVAAYMPILKEVLKGIYYKYDINFEKGCAVANYEIIGSNEYIDMIKSLVTTPSKRHLKYIPEDAVATANIALDIESLLPFIPNGIDVDKLLSAVGLDSSVFKSISGDYTFAVLPAENFREGKYPQLMFVADCADRRIFDLIIQSGGLGEIKYVEDDVYALNLNKYNEYNYYINGYLKKKGGYDYFLMYKDNAIFFIPENIYYSIKDGDGITSLADSMADDNTMNRIASGAVLDFDKLHETIMGMGEVDESLAKFAEFCLIFENLVVDMPNSENVEMKLNLKEKDENFLKYILDMAIENML